MVFILGVAFAQWIIPLIDGLVNLLLQKFELIKSPMVLSIQADTNALEKLKNELGEEPVNQIGFIIPSEEEDDDSEE